MKDEVVAKRRNGRVYPAWGVQVVAGDIPFEIWVRRPTKADPFEATRAIRPGGGVHHEKLPDGVVRSWNGLKDFTRLIVKKNGEKVADKTYAYCPYGGRRSGPEAPETTPYPRWCEGGRLTVGMVWGLQAHWRAPLLERWRTALRLPVGIYRARISVTKQYREMFDIPADQADAIVRLKVERGERRRGTRSQESPHLQTAAEQSAAPLPQPAAEEPGDEGKAAPKRYRPDLRPLPAWSIHARTGRTRDFVVFSANVWNAGPAPLVVDGFRRRDEAAMDGYQYFYNDDGERVGYTKTGKMMWDDRDGHHHWHFKDFAGYRLLDANQQKAVRSHKEAFCIVPTDAIDYTVPNADWRPGSGDLHTACGGKNAQSVREVMEVGSGDTYSQSTPGQAFTVTGLPNGIYFVEVTANPLGRLYEADMDNNVSLRKIRLGGAPGERTAKVLPDDR